MFSLDLPPFSEWWFVGLATVSLATEPVTTEPLSSSISTSLKNKDLDWAQNNINRAYFDNPARIQEKTHITRNESHILCE